jgi:hypothetical protein
MSLVLLTLLRKVKLNFGLIVTDKPLVATVCFSFSLQPSVYQPEGSRKMVSSF